MATSSTHHDPRSIVTPDAFNVSEDLLGSPLASPRRRLAALVIDLMVIGLVTLMTRSFALVLGVVAAGFFMRAGFQRTPVKGNVFGRAMRGSVGCLGFVIALLTIALWTTCGPDFGGGGSAPNVTVMAEGEGAERFAAGAALVTLTIAFASAEDITAVEEAALVLITVAPDIGMGREEVLGTLRDAVPEDARWAGDAEALFARLLAPEGGVTADLTALEEEIADLTVEEALVAYAAARDADEEDEEAQSRLAALERRLSGIVAADTLETQASRIIDLESANRGLRDDLDDAEANLAEATSGGVFGWLRSFVDELGFGFGWASLYLTVFLSWWKGQTVGKRMLKIRVVRLDGEPITWWVAFERAGGYAAGFATGLLGFAQVYWDANRQGIHDRIVGTVVVMDGAEKVTDWESAL